MLTSQIKCATTYAKIVAGNVLLGPRTQHRITVVKGQYAWPEAQLPQRCQQPVSAQHFAYAGHLVGSGSNAQSLIELVRKSICRQSVAIWPIPPAQPIGHVPHVLVMASPLNKKICQFVYLYPTNISDLFVSFLVLFFHPFNLFYVLFSLLIFLLFSLFSLFLLF